MTVYSKKMASSFAINGQLIGPGHPPYIIAEVSGNHNQLLAKALRLIEVAKEAGADAVKFQTYTADSMTIPSDDPDFQITSGTWDGWNLHELYKSAATPYEWFPQLFAHAKKVGITMLSSPFDLEAVERLEEWGAPAYKIASNEFTDWPLVARVARTGKPLILSTGTANLEDMDSTMDFIKRQNVSECALLHCVSAYPAPLEAANLHTIKAIAERYNVPAGFSDHSLGITAPVVATALGAKIIEKHFILARSEGGPDSSFALEPQELAEMCSAVQQAHDSAGTVSFGMSEFEKESPIYKRCFYTTRDLEVGEKISPANVRAIRARSGISSQLFEKVFGSTVIKALPRYTALSYEYIELEEYS